VPDDIILRFNQVRPQMDKGTSEFESSVTGDGKIVFRRWKAWALAGYSVALAFAAAIAVIIVTSWDWISVPAKCLFTLVDLVVVALIVRQIIRVASHTSRIYFTIDPATRQIVIYGATSSAKVTPPNLLSPGNAPSLYSFIRLVFSGLIIMAHAEWKPVHEVAIDDIHYFLSYCQHGGRSSVPMLNLVTKKGSIYQMYTMGMELQDANAKALGYICGKLAISVREGASPSVCYVTQQSAAELLCKGQVLYDPESGLP